MRLTIGFDDRLHLLEQGDVDDRFMLPGVRNPLMGDLAEIDRILEQVEQGTPAERSAASERTRRST